MRFGPPPPPSSASSLKGKASSYVDAGTKSTTTPRKYVARYVAAKVPSHVVPARRKTNAPATTTSAGAGIGNFKRAVQPAPATTASVAVWNDEQHGEDGKNGDAVNDSENVVPNVPQQDSPVIKFDHGKATANSPVVQHTVGATNAITMLDDVDAIAQRMHGVTLTNGHDSSNTVSMPTHGPLKYVARDLIQEMDTVLAPVLLDDGVSVAKRDRALHDYIQMMRSRVVQPLFKHQQHDAPTKTPMNMTTRKTTTPTSDTTPSHAHQSQSKRVFAVRDVDGATAVVLSPIRVARRKDRDTLGTDHVITPLRRSVRHLNAHTHEERLARGLDFEVAGVHEVFDATGCYAFTPNKSLRGYDKAAATGSGDGGEGLAMTVDASKSAGKWRK